MAGRGMGAATRGGGAVSSGPRNKKISSPSPKVKVMMARGGMANRGSMDTGRRKMSIERLKNPAVAHVGAQMRQAGGRQAALRKSLGQSGSVPPMPATGMPKAMQTGGQKLGAQKLMAKGGAVKKKGKFPDLTGDGKVTKADVLKGRGVKRMRGGGMAKKKMMAKGGMAKKKMATKKMRGGGMAMKKK